MEWMSVVQWAFRAGIGINCALVLSLIFRKTNLTANRLLCVYILSVAYLQWVHFLDYTGLIESYPYLVRTPFPVSFLIIWSLYEYVLAFTTPDLKIDKKAWGRLTPFFIAAIWCAHDITARTPGEPALTKEFFEDRVYRGVLVLVVFAVYLGFIIQRMRYYRHGIENIFSDLSRVRLTWLAVLVGFCCVLWGVALIDFLMGVHVTLWHITIPLISVGTFSLAVFTLRQSVIFNRGDQVLGFAVAKPKPVKEVLFSPEELNRQTERLRVFLQKEKPYLNPELRLSDLASSLEIKPYQLTEIINRGERKNFYELINSYRVEEFKRRAKDPTFAHLSLLGLAMDSGFNSKSVFNETFRKMTGQTPSEFRSST